MIRLLCGDKNLGLPAYLVFGTIYGEPGSCATEADPLAACTGIVPFRTIVTIIGFVSRVYFSSQLLPNFMFFNPL